MRIAVLRVCSRINLNPGGKKARALPKFDGVQKAPSTVACVLQLRKHTLPRSEQKGFALTDIRAQRASGQIKKEEGMSWVITWEDAVTAVTT